MASKETDKLIAILLRGRDRAAHCDHPQSRAERDLVRTIEHAHHDKADKGTIRALMQALQDQIAADAEAYRTNEAAYMEDIWAMRREDIARWHGPKISK